MDCTLGTSSDPRRDAGLSYPSEEYRPLPARALGRLPSASLAANPASRIVAACAALAAARRRKEGPAPLLATLAMGTMKEKLQRCVPLASPVGASAKAPGVEASSPAHSLSRASSAPSAAPSATAVAGSTRRTVSVTAVSAARVVGEEEREGVGLRVAPGALGVVEGVGVLEGEGRLDMVSLG